MPSPLQELGIFVATKDVTVIYDESGTPEIGKNDRTDWFLGVAVRYDQSAENEIFFKCTDEFGLANTKPLKNDRIKNSRAIRIAELLADLPLSIFVSGVNTADPEYREIIVDYVRLGNMARKQFRQVGERPIAQTMHSQLIDHCLFHSITDCFEAGGGDAEFAVYIDNWSIPQSDVEIYLGDRAMSLDSHISSFCDRHHFGQPKSIARLQLLVEDTVRKRFVDVTTSVLSRTYLKSDNPRYSREPADILERRGKAQFGDATGSSIRIMQKTMMTLLPANHTGP